MTTETTLAEKFQPHFDKVKATTKAKIGEAKEYFKEASSETDKKTFKAMGLGASFALAVVGLLNVGSLVVTSVPQIVTQEQQTEDSWTTTLDSLCGRGMIFNYNMGQCIPDYR